jgi:hypothetical protein
MKKIALYSGAALAAGLLVYLLLTKKPGQGMAAAAGEGIVGGAVDFAGGVVSGGSRALGGFVEGIGSVLGVPVTNQTQCQKDLAAGNHWAASFSCPASDFIGNVFGSNNLSTAAVIDASRIDDQRIYAGGTANFYSGGGGEFTGTGATGKW